MNITFLSPPPDLTGGQRVVAIYARILRFRGHNVNIICNAQRERGTGRFHRVRNLICGRVDASPASNHYANYNVKCSVLAHDGPLNDDDVPIGDVAVATWWETAEWLHSLDHSKGAKVHLIQHHEVFPYVPTQRVHAIYRLPLRRVCVARWLQNVMLTEYSDRSAVVVPNAVDLNQFVASPRVKREGQVTVGVMYSTAAFKRIEFSLSAIEQAKQRGIDVRTVAFGTHAPTKQRHRSLIDSFFVSPKQDELWKVYTKCDAWLFGSGEEGFGLPILEAMACGVPVIGTPAGAAPELLGDGSGILVDLSDPSDMADAIATVAAMANEEWQELSAAALRRASAYTWDDATDQFEAALIAARDDKWDEHCRAQSERANLP